MSCKYVRSIFIFCETAVKTIYFSDTVFTKSWTTAFSTKWFLSSVFVEGIPLSSSLYLKSHLKRHLKRHLLLYLLQVQPGDELLLLCSSVYRMKMQRSALHSHSQRQRQRQKERQVAVDSQIRAGSEGEVIIRTLFTFFF